VLGFELAEYG